MGGRSKINNQQKIRRLQYQVKDLKEKQEKFKDEPMRCENYAKAIERRQQAINYLTQSENSLTWDMIEQKFKFRVYAV